MNGDVEFFPEEVPKAFLKQDNGGVGDGVGEPAGCNGDGDVGAEANGSDGCEDHLANDWELPDEETDGQSMGDSVPAGVPEFSVKNRREDLLEELVAAKFWAAQETIGTADKPEVSFSNCGCHVKKSFAFLYAGSGPNIQETYQSASNSFESLIARICPSLSET